MNVSFYLVKSNLVGEVEYFGGVLWGSNLFYF